MLEFILSKETTQATKASVPLPAKLWQLIPAIMGGFFFFFLGLQPKPNLDHIGSGVAELSSGSVLLEHRGQLLYL